MANQHGHREDLAGRLQPSEETGIIAVDLDDGDYLIGAALTDGKHDVMLFAPAAGRAFDKTTSAAWAATPAACGMMLERISASSRCWSPAARNSRC